MSGWTNINEPEELLKPDRRPWLNRALATGATVVLGVAATAVWFTLYRDETGGKTISDHARAWFATAPATLVATRVALAALLLNGGAALVYSHWHATERAVFSGAWLAGMLVGLWVGDYLGVRFWR